MVSVYDQRDARTLRFIVYTTSLDGANQYVFYGGAPGGGAGDLSGVNWQFDVDRVPTATFRVRNPQLTGIGYRSPVEIRASFQGLPTIVFRGVVLDWARDAEGITYQCVGRSWSLDVPYQEVLGIFQGPITSQQAVLNMLGNAGLTAYSTVSLPAWTIGSVARQTLSFGTWGDAIRKVIEVEDAHWWEDRVGNVHVSNLALVPAPTAVRTYYAALTPVALVEQTPAGVTAGYRPRIRSGQNQTDVRAVKNRILVRGASLSTTGADGTATTANIEANASAPSPYVVKPDGTQDYSDFVFSNELIDYQAKADEVALRYLSKLNRLENRYTVVIDGDPRVQLGETVKIIDYDYLGIVGNFVVQGYQTQMDESDFVTTLQLTAGGLSVNQDPVAVFQYTVDREVFNDRVYAIVTFDARDSYDLDGTIASYSWTDNQTPDIAAGTAPVFTVKVDPATLSPAAWTVTLVVTDNAGSTDTFTLTVDIKPDADFVFTPAFTAALDPWFSATPDGGQTWRDKAGTSVISTACGDMSLAPGIAVYGTTAGGIWRTTDYCFTAPTQVMANAGNPMVDLEWDRYRPNLVWGVTQSGRVYRSNDAGVTWALWDSLSTVFASTNIRLNRVHSIPTGVRVYGALNGVPLIASDKLLGHVWTRAAIGGELAADLAGAPSDVYVADAAWQEDDKVAIILNHSGGVTVTGLAFKAGTYVGDGSASLPITGIGFPPKVVFVHADPDTEATSAQRNGMMRTTTMSVSRNVQNTTTNQGIASLDADGFTVSKVVAVNGKTNEAGVTYFYQVFGGKSCFVGSYTGNGGASQSITGIGFRPEVVGVATLVQFSSLVFLQSTQPPGGPDLPTTTINGLLDRLLTLDADGFTVGSNGDLNTLADVCHYWAFKAAGNLALGKYPGINGAQTVPAVPFSFTPDAVWIKNPDVGCSMSAVFKTSDMTVGDALLWGPEATQTNEIQALLSGQFNLAVPDITSSSNFYATGTEHFFALQENSGIASTPLPCVYYTEDIDGAGSAWTRAANQPTDKTRGRWIAEDLESGKFVLAFNDRVHYRGDVSAGIMSVTAAVAQLDVGDAPNHGLFVGQRLQGMAGVYVISAEDTGGAQVETGSYVGTGAASRNITVSMGRPDFILIYQGDAPPNSSATKVKGPDSIWGANSGELDGGLENATDITSLHSTGFTVGLTMNQSPANYRWVAFKGPGIAQGTYIGSFPTPQSITGLGFTPQMVWTIDATAGRAGCVKMASMGGANSLPMGDAAGFETNEITSLNVNGFTVTGSASSGSNENLHKYYYIAFASMPNMTLGSYSGDGADNRNIVAGTFKYAMVLGNLAQHKVDRIDTVVGDSSHEVSNSGAFFANGIQTMTPNLQVGTDARVNQAASTPTYYYMVFTAGSASGPDGTLYKTFDRFATIGKLRPATGYPAMPAGANAKMADLGRSLAPQGMPLLVDQSTAFGTATYARRIAKLGAAWSLVTDPGAASQLPVTLFQRLGTHLYRVLAGNITSHLTPYYGQLQRSTDGGVTWANVGPTLQETGTGAGNDRKGVSGVCLAADGSLYLTYSPNDAASISLLYGYPEVYKSVDAGATWSVVYTDTTLDGGRARKMFAICAHPSNKNIVFIIGHKSNTTITVSWNTADAGVSWTYQDYSGAGCGAGSGTGAAAVVMFSGGDVLLFTPGADVCLISAPTYSCCDQAWSISGSGDRTYGYLPLWVPGDRAFFVAANPNDDDLRRSDDLGRTWVTLLSTSVATYPNGQNIRALFYDAANDALYIALESSSTTGRILRLASATQPVIGALTDLSLNLDDLFTAAGASQEHIGVRGITI